MTGGGGRREFLEAGLKAARATLTAQADATLANAGRGFLLVYLNSFNEWHEGHAFEPM